MKYLIKYKLFEKISNEEIKDLFFDLTDNGFKIDINDIIHLPHGPHSMIDFTHPLYIDDMMGRNSGNFMGVTIYKGSGYNYIGFNIDEKLIENIEFAINYMKTKNMEFTYLIPIGRKIDMSISYDIKNILNLTDVFSILLIFEY